MVGYFNVPSQAKQYKYQDLASEGYLKNAIVYRCVNEISKGISAVPFKLFNKNEEVIEQHPIIEVLNKPNPLQSRSEFMNSLVGFLMLSGNAYVLKIGADNRPPKELHLLRPDRIEVKGSNRPIPESYEYRVNGKTEAIYPVDSDSGASELKHIKLWHLSLIHI